uniref:UDP-glycosyltransferase n=1 Tax=Daucus carota subsp. sativus TaxID=79200 RepID=A0A164Z136_DAUCS
MSEASNKPHALCIPYPSQDFNRNRLIRARGPDALDGFPDFRFYSVPDGLAVSDPDATQDTPTLCKYAPINCFAPLCDLISTLNDSFALGVPPVTCIVSDGVMSFTLKAAQQFGIPEVLLWTTSACGLLAYMHYSQLVERGYAPLQALLFDTASIVGSNRALKLESSKAKAVILHEAVK